ncbi:alcohol dehydrogenase catalytic domain-containing protein [Mycolicibacterium fluoranthenivorans]|uniref:Zn-dependent alcohol dehydrogenase n=1 Tax=Mycolicibacterium fluoranthenivorans TaxID=258505 RepID=A0A7X5ZCL8_9MYCO|nr:alcohol dehydrogenase catalytic domain-containing protein [Mycolicibacterium fluoranthenivorans]NIH95140.1 Zn-dependent alcohol dehydrogenase [Mycolicibacterium fluoranthenivorans]
MKTKGALVWDFHTSWSVEPIEIGPGVDDLVVGDHVAMSVIPSCGTCPACQSGVRNLCDLGMGLLSGPPVSDGSFDMLEGRNLRGVIRFTEADR